MYLLGGTLEENAHKAHRKLVFAQEIIIYLAHAPNGHLERTQSVGWKNLERTFGVSPKGCSTQEYLQMMFLWRYSKYRENLEIQRMNSKWREHLENLQNDVPPSRTFRENT